MSALIVPAVARPESAVDRLSQSTLRRLLAGGAVAAAAWAALPSAAAAALAAAPDLSTLAAGLLGRRLLTPFQAGRVRDGHLGGLVLGNYRLLDRLGGGPRGDTFRAEHLALGRPAAVKALHPTADRKALGRLFLDVRAVANLRHPGIVAVADAGEEPQAGPDGQPVPYLVSELPAGRTLADLVAADGPLDPAAACQMLHAVAEALTDAHRHGLVHRGLTPSNVLVTPDGHARLLDFGVGRLPGPASAFTAPEVARDPATCDARADVYGLAATLRFAVAGRLAALPGLAAAIDRMLATDPNGRTPTAAAAGRELARFRPDAPPPLAAVTPPPAAGHRVLVVDDEESIRTVCRLALRGEPLVCDEAADGPAALDRLAAGGYDLVLLDVDLPGLDGERVLRRLRASPPAAHVKVLMLSGRSDGDDLSRLLAAGADDHLGKPFSPVQCRGRVQALLRLKDAQDRADALTRQLATANAQLEAAVSAKADELVHARSAMVLALAKLVEQKSAESGGHLLRIQRYVRVLAEAAAATPAFAGRLDPDFVAVVEAVSPLHDIGKVGVPDAVLNKPGPLTPDERRQMQAHADIGADTLAEVAARYPLFAGFFATAVDVARCHHERWDGSGYPRRLAGEAIPLAARLVAVADVYDALRSRRVYKPGLSHTAAVGHIVGGSPGHFDPALVAVFGRAAGQFDRVFRETAD